MTSLLQANSGYISQTYDSTGKIVESEILTPINFDYKPPQDSLRDALNFSEETEPVSSIPLQLTPSTSSSSSSSSSQFQQQKQQTKPLLMDNTTNNTNTTKLGRQLKQQQEQKTSYDAPNNVTAAAFAAGMAPNNTSSAMDSTNKMKQFVNTMLQKMNNTKYLYPAMAVLIMAIIVIIVLFQKISTIVKIICVVLLIVFMTVTVMQFKQI